MAIFNDKKINNIRVVDLMIFAYCVIAKKHKKYYSADTRIDDDELKYQYYPEQLN